MRLRSILLIVALLLPIGAYAQTGTSKSDSALYTELPDNTSNAILPAYVRDVVASKLSISPAIVAAAGTNQSGATVLTTMFSTVTSGTGGVVAQGTGHTKIWNSTQAAINVYPASGAQFDGNGINMPTFLPAGGWVEVTMTSSTQGYARPSARNPWLQPFASTDFWNIGIGSGATFESTGATQTARLITLLGAINSTVFNQPFYLGHSTDPAVNLVCNDAGGTSAPMTTQPFHVPIGAAPSFGNINNGTFTGSQSGTTLTVSAISSPFIGTIAAGYNLNRATATGTSNYGETFLTQLSGSAGGVGTYQMDQSLTLGSRTFTVNYGDQHMNLFDATNPNIMVSFYSSYPNNPDANGAVTTKTNTITGRFCGVYNAAQSGVYPNGAVMFPGDNGSGTQGDYNFGIGTIRDWEITAGAINHALRYALSDDVETWVVGPQTPVGYWTSNVQWPSAHTDYCGGPTSVTGCGSQQFGTPGCSCINNGATISIPSSTVLTGRGLSAAGLMLATAIQKYGMTQRDSGGGPTQITLYTDNISGGNTTAVSNMASDFNSIIVPLLRVMTNQSTNGQAPINGGGTYPALAAPATASLMQ